MLQLVYPIDSHDDAKLGFGAEFDGGLFGGRIGCADELVNVVGNDPTYGASPNEKIPPSEATNQ